MINEEGVVECSCLSGNEAERGAEESFPQEVAHAPGELSGIQGALLGKSGGWREMSLGLSEDMSLIEHP